MVDRYDAVTPFGKKGQGRPPSLPSEPWRYGRPYYCQAMDVRRLTFWRGSTGTMEIMALPGSTLLSLWSFQSFIFSFIPYFYHYETVALCACPFIALGSLSFQKSSAQKISTFPPAPWHWILKSRSYTITFSNASHQLLFACCTWFGVCHVNPPAPLQLPRQLIDGPIRRVQKWRLWCGWHWVRTSLNCNFLLQISLRPQQCIVNCATKVNQSDSDIRRNPHLNDLQYNIRAVVLRSIVNSSGNICRYGGDRSVGGNGRWCRRSGDGSGGYINGSKRLGHKRSFPPWGDGVLWSNTAVEDIWWKFPPLSFPFPSLTQCSTTLCVDTYRLYYGTCMNKFIFQPPWMVEL